MERYGIVADLHLGIRQYEGIFRLQEEIADNSVPARMYIVCKALEKWVKKNKVKKLIVLGDIFHKQDNISLTEVLWAKILLKNLTEENKIEILLVEGNHDICNGLSALKLIENSNVKIITYNYCSKNLPFDFVEKDFAGQVKYAENDLFMILPFTSDKDLVLKFMDKVGNKVLLTHLTINKVKLPNGAVLEGIEMKKDVAIISGHIHLAQTIGAIVYVGCFSHNDFGECGIPMGGLVLDTENGDISGLKYAQNDYGIEFLNQPILPKAKRFIYRLKDTPEIKKWVSENKIEDKVVFLGAEITKELISLQDNPVVDLKEDFIKYVDEVVNKTYQKKVLSIGLPLVEKYYVENKESQN